MNKKRIAKWDNAKALLIFLVVMGHFADRFAGDNSRVKGLFFCIYLFHMAAFFFLSGMLSKNTLRSEKFPWKRIVPYYFLSVLLNYFRILTQRPWNPSLEFRFFHYGNVSWYLFTLFVFLSAGWLLSKIPRKTACLLLLLLALGIGYIRNLGSFLAIYRIGNFFFFFYSGYCFSEDRIRKYVETKAIKRISTVFLLTYIGICLVFSKELYRYRKLITGANSYYSMDIEVNAFTWIYRMICIVIVMIIILTIISLVPDIHFPRITVVGRRTLAIYFWHLALVEIVVHNKAFLYAIEINNLVLLMVFIVCSAIIVFVLSFRVFYIPLEWFIRLPERLIHDK